MIDLSGGNLRGTRVISGRAKHGAAAHQLPGGNLILTVHPRHAPRVTGIRIRLLYGGDAYKILF